MALLLGIQMLGQTSFSQAGAIYIAGLAVITMAAIGLLMFMNTRLRIAERTSIAAPVESPPENML
jgi:hypothetical protein